ncbi:MAG: superoxide dismutase [Oscillospiraceae bacterium]|nr:superoxide dismutase [Oscillospiraceae bacterium]
MQNMQDMKYPFTLPALPYAYDALEPYIDTETMHYHHDKHFQTYINNLNDALKMYPRLQNMTLRQLLCSRLQLPADVRDKIMNNGGGVFNHNLFFQGLAPAAEPVHTPQGAFAAEINQTFGSFAQLKKAFNEQALAVFGSGWSALIRDKLGRLQIVQLKNQETTLMYGVQPLLLLDVWEHAYYLKYKNDRKDYVENAWNVLVMPQA